MSNTKLLPFQPDSMTPAQLERVSYLARYSGHTHGPPSSLFVSRQGSKGSVQDELWRASICRRFGQRSQTGTRANGASCASRSAPWGPYL